MASIRSQESFLAKLVSALGGQLGILLFGMGTQIVVARTLGPAGKGVFSLTLAVAITLATLVHLSLATGNSHFMGRYPDQRRALAGNSFLMAFLWGAIVTVLVLALKQKLPVEYQPKISPSLWGMALVAIIPLLLLEYSNGLVMGLDWIKRLSFSLVLKEALILGGVLWLATLGHISVEGAVAIWVTAIVITALFQSFSAWSKIGLRITISPKLFGSMMLFSIQSHAANVFSFLKFRFDFFLIDHFLTSSELGIYSIAVIIVQVLWYLPKAIAQILVPHISWGGDKAAEELTPLLSRLGFTVAIIGGCLLSILGRPLIGLFFTNSFLPAYPIMLLLLPGAIIYSFAGMLSGDLIGRGLPRYAMFTSIFAFTLNVAVNLVLIPKFGLVGAAIASTITHAFSGFMFLFYFIRESGVSFSDTMILKRDDITELLQLMKRK
ncbi:polysaccharide biosynthesis C-terminal domain-containing protein [bacterium]|nr:polysaccharide biosynthesis C-terminal domain-containing protein [bacterium]